MSKHLKFAAITRILLHFIAWIGFISAEVVVCFLLWCWIADFIETPSLLYDNYAVLVLLWLLSMMLLGIYMGVVAFRYAYLHRLPKSLFWRNLQILFACLVLLVALPSSIFWVLMLVPAQHANCLDILLFIDAWTIPVAIITICSEVIIQCSATRISHKH